MNRWTRLGIEAYRAGNRPQAQRFFRIAMMEDPDNIQPWLWMVEVVETDAEKLHFLERVVMLDPDHQLAQKALQNVKARLKSAGLPHVNPFSADEPDAPAAQQLPASTPISSTPPFMAALAARNPPELEDGLPPARPPLSEGFPWLLVAGVLFGLVLIAVMVLLLTHPF